MALARVQAENEVMKVFLSTWAAVIPPLTLFFPTVSTITIWLYTRKQKTLDNFVWITSAFIVWVGIEIMFCLLYDNLAPMRVIQTPTVMMSIIMLLPAYGVMVVLSTIKRKDQKHYTKKLNQVYLVLFPIWTVLFFFFVFLYPYFLFDKIKKNKG